MQLMSNNDQNLNRSACSAFAALAICSLAIAGPPDGKGGGNGGGGGGGGDDGSGTPPADPAIVYADNGDIRVMNEDGSNDTLVIAGAGGLLLAPSFTPDGSGIVFNGDAGSGLGIYRIDVDGSNLQFLTSLASDGAADPVVSPVAAADGEFKVAFADETDDTNWDVFIINLDGTGRTNLTNTQERFEGYPSWAPDAQSIAAEALSMEENSPFENLYVYELDLVDSQIAVVAAINLLDVPGGPFDGAPIGSISLAWPDFDRTNGRYILAAIDAGSLTTSWDIWRFDLEDPANPVNLTFGQNSVERQPVWSPDESQILFWKTGHRKHSGIYVMQADGTNATKLNGRGKAPDWRRSSSSSRYAGAGNTDGVRCTADLNRDGIVNHEDLLMEIADASVATGLERVLNILASWGLCPQYN